VAAIAFAGAVTTLVLVACNTARATKTTIVGYAP
jgi:hypothetical protein